MDAFLPGVGNWKDVWLMRDLWHFHFYGETPLALVKGRERIYFEHFWNDFAADRTQVGPRGGPPALRRGLRASRTACAPASSTSRRFEQDAKDFAALRGDQAGHARSRADRREGLRHVPHRAGQAGGDQRRGTVVKGSGHWLMDEAPEQVVPAIVAFLR